MKKLFWVLPLTASLASCGVLGVPNGDVSGSITGTPTKTGPIKIALTGLTTTGVVSDTPDQLAVGTFNPAKNLYTISLPAQPNPGLYSVYAYTDVNGNGKFDLLSESRTRLGEQFLKYSADKGWELMRGLTVVQSARPFTYDLAW